MNGNPFSTALYVCVCASAGLLAGFAYFLALHRTVVLLGGGRGWLGPAVLTLTRIAGASVVVILVARLGALTLLAGFSGFLLARAIAVSAAWRAR